MAISAATATAHLSAPSTHSLPLPLHHHSFLSFPSPTHTHPANTPSLKLRPFPSSTRSSFHIFSFAHHGGGSSGGSNFRGGSGGGGGGGGKRGGEGHHGDGNVGEKNRAEAILVLSETGRSVDSLPKDMAAVIEGGKIPGMIVQRYFELEKSLILRWLLRFGGFRERLLGDDLFLAKLGMECGVGIFTKIMALVADFMLVWLPAPTVYLRPPLAITAAGGPLINFFYNCPDNAFQIALPGTSYTFLQRLGALLVYFNDLWLKRKEVKNREGDAMN